jgi:hypothetical protein
MHPRLLQSIFAAQVQPAQAQVTIRKTKRVNASGLKGVLMIDGEQRLAISPDCGLKPARVLFFEMSARENKRK